MSRVEGGASLLPDPRAERARVHIEKVSPEVDGGKYPAKRVVGDRVVVEADLVSDGHDKVAGALLYRHQDEEKWREVPLQFVVNDRWRASFEVGTIGRWLFTIEAWPDPFTTWQLGLRKKVEAGQDVSVELLMGADLVLRAAEIAPAGADRQALLDAEKALRGEDAEMEARVEVALSEALAETMARHPDRSDGRQYDRELAVFVDRPRARFSSWYEFFPRSTGPGKKHGTFRDAEKMLPYIAELGFDVVYLPPIHPIGRAYRKGPNNTLEAGADDPGSPWAIGGPEGGHKAIHPELGTLEDFRRFVAEAEKHGLEVALDVAFQASPDHPYVKDHPEWFKKRPDGTIQYAENPPKKYQDVYPFDFETEHWRELWAELLSVFLHWIEQGVRIFRVDNPHTKPLPFWEWCIGEIKARHPDVIFLAEAFTRPKLMYALAKLGFSQGYTYFTWRNTRWELTEYMTELTRTEVADYFRPNFWPNTPDILPEHLQHGGRGAFMGRLVLATTLTSNWGMYGPAFELMEHVARPGSEEYIDNEKFELKEWDLDRPDSLRHLIARMNRIRHQHPALQDNRSLRFHETDNEQLICYSKQQGEDIIVCVVNLDHWHRHSGWIDLDLHALGLPRDRPYQMHDLISGARFYWNGPRNFIELDPHTMPAHVFKARRHVRTEYDFDYFG